MISSTVFLLKTLLNSKQLSLNLLRSAFVLKQQKPELVALASCRRALDYTTGLACIGLVGSLLVPSSARALPAAGEVQAGQAQINQVNPDQLNIIQQSDRAVINWQGFSVGEQQQVNFQQPSATSATLNRVTGNDRSDIAGRVTANGTVMLVNPNGILFGSTAVVDVAGLMATTLDIRNQDFLNGQYSFSAVPGKPAVMVENQGQITVKEGELAALVAPGVANNGVINARLGKVVLASGTKATLDLTGDGLVSLAVDPTLAQQLQGADGKPLSSLVSHSGQINADGGVVTLSARAGKAVVDNAINVSGVIQARSVSNHKGEIVLSGEDQGNITVTGKLDTSGTAGQNAGNISLFSGNTIDTTQGSLNSGSDIGKAGSIYIAANSHITTGNINATGEGTNGSITLNSTTGNIDTTAGSLNGSPVVLRAAGDIKTGNISSRSVGDGGNIHLTSGKATIDTTQGTLDSDSVTGKAGSIYIAANSHITTGNINTTGRVANGGINLLSPTGSIDTTAGTLNGGTVSLEAASNIKTSSISSRSAADDGGKISLISGDAIDTASGTLTARSSSDSVSSGEISLTAKGNIAISRLTSGTSDGNAGNLTLFSTEGEIVLNSDYNLSAVITSGNVKLGVFGKGNLGGEDVGIYLAGLGDAIMPGCLCEGWGVAGNGIAGGASVHNSSPRNLKLTAFASTPSSATSTVELSTLPSLQITQAYLPAAEAPTALFENRVTITNKGSDSISDIRYTRAMDWDVPPQEFNEYVTISGREGAKNVLYSSNNGFSTVNPLESKTYIPYYQKTETGEYALDENGNYIEKGAETVNADFVDAGSGDHGAVFDLGFGSLAGNSSTTFSIYYGATYTEATAIGALTFVKAEMFSLGQSSPDGSPGTFIFGFKSIGGQPLGVEPPPLPTIAPATSDSIIVADAALDIVAEIPRIKLPALDNVVNTFNQLGDNVKEFTQGFTYQTLKNNTSVFLPLTDPLNPEGARIRARLEKLKSGSAPFQWGRGTATLAGIAQALLEISSGTGSTGGGMALTSTGVGAPVGAVAMAAGYAQILHGAAVGGASVQDLSNLVSYVFRSQNSGSGGGASTGSVNIPNRDKPRIEDGNLREGWKHIDARHITGNHPSGAGELFPPGTTRQQLQEAAEQIIAKGTRISAPKLRIQTFENRIIVNSKRMRVRLIVDSKDGNRVITIFPVTK